MRQWQTSSATYGKFWANKIDMEKRPNMKMSPSKIAQGGVASIGINNTKANQDTFDVAGTWSAKSGQQRLDKEDRLHSRQPSSNKNSLQKNRDDMDFEFVFGDWILARDEETGKFFYLNTSTREVSMVVPEEVVTGLREEAEKKRCRRVIEYLKFNFIPPAKHSEVEECLTREGLISR